MAVPSPQEILAWEARVRPRAAIAALVGAVGLIVATFFSSLLFGDAPQAWYGAALGRAAAPGSLATQQSLQVPFYEFYDDRSGLVLLGSAIRAIGWAATGWALYILAGSTISRRPELPKAVVYLPLFGGFMSAVATLLVDVASKIGVDDFLSGPRTVAAAQDVTTSPLLVIGQFLGLAGALGAALAFVLICLNAMRAGLLTRFTGVLGILVGALLTFPVGPLGPLIQFYWLVALALLFLGRWPGGAPLAWSTGRAETWPSAAQQRGRARGEEPAVAPAPTPAGATTAAARAGGGARKKKRKHR